MKCNKCNKEVDKCKDCDSDFNSADDICCVKTDFFGNGKNVYYRHICKKCANKLINSQQ